MKPIDGRTKHSFIGYTYVNLVSIMSTFGLIISWDKNDKIF